MGASVGYNAKILKVANRSGIVLGGIPTALAVIGAVYGVFTGQLFSSYSRVGSDVISMLVVGALIYGFCLGIGWVVSAVKTDT